MTFALPISPRAFLPGLITRGLANGTLHLAWSLVSPFSTAAPRESVRVPSPAHLDGTASTPIVLVHGFLGSPLNFLSLRRFLGALGVRTFASFSYAPRLDYQALARQLRHTIQAVCDATGAREVDVVGHSLGGLIARHLLETDPCAPIRRLITLGSPCLSRSLPPQELAVFGTADLIVAAPDRLDGRTVVVPGCGHLALLHHPAVLHRVADFLAAPAEEEPSRMLEAA